ncbi:MAG: hypothetical protein GX969_00645 [Firmicutes bacterium]|nr:hypothetical protein [Bacillota bacterium]
MGTLLKLKSNKFRLCFISALIVLILSLGLVSHQVEGKVKVTASERVILDLDTDIAVFEGNVTIIYENIKITADRAEVKERKIAVLTGNTKLVQIDMILTGKNFIVYINENKIIAEGDVFLIKGETEIDEIQNSHGEENITTIACEKMMLFTKERGFTAEGDIEVRRGLSLAKADYATYKEEEEKVILTGNVTAEGKNGEKIECNMLIFGTDKDYMEAEAEVVFEFSIDRED